MTLVVVGVPNIETLKAYFKEINDNDPTKSGILAIFDDSAENSDTLNHLFTVGKKKHVQKSSAPTLRYPFICLGSHHWKVTTVCLVQNLFSQNQEFRSIQANASYLGKL